MNETDGKVGEKKLIIEQDVYDGNKSEKTEYLKRKRTKKSHIIEFIFN